MYMLVWTRYGEPNADLEWMMVDHYIIYHDKTEAENAYQDLIDNDESVYTASVCEVIKTSG